MKLIGKRALKLQFWTSGFIVNRHFSHLQPFMEPLKDFEHIPDIQKRIEEQRKEFYNSPTQNIAKLFKGPIEQSDNPDIAITPYGQMFWIGPLSENDKMDKLHTFEEEESIFLKDLEANGISPDLTPSLRARLLQEEENNGSLDNSADIKIVLPQQSINSNSEDDFGNPKKKKNSQPPTSIRFDSVYEAPIIGTSFGPTEKVQINDGE